ncbi:FMN reductase (NADPH) [Paenibacillus sp. UNCCL117]|uniref:oxygen-insensitive NADPH nitroreductase n=1 Tax=unclassified Paenibacillus TaxID=185978 RepID=UPI00088E3CCF|nr:MULTISPECIES: oxygen-insensitive NADPH nitroreductase [unclassified Paenibacillus]SDD63438.1 FMN reductase (NADPH) [Paenibacillus sp. cl123]SFW58521.1 FMN reductase (NADPH) [Paenibacillus sp. UNCCL117]
MNTVIELLQRHRSIRKFKPVPLTSEQIDAIVSSAQMASSSSNVQAYSLIAIRDAGIRSKLAELAGNQSYVADCGLFIVFCADLQRLQEATLRHREPFHTNTESFLVATVDAALAAQNAAVAAESLGLGICYIGGIRNSAEEVSRLLKLPQLVYPVFGLCIGTPDQEPSHRPRLPQAGVLHWDAYDEEAMKSGLDEYDRIMHNYYKERTQGKTLTTWSRGIADKYKKPVRAHMKAFLEARGFKLN